MKTFKQLLEEVEYNPNHPDPKHHEVEFHRRVAKYWPNGMIVFHEAPGHVASSIRKHGIKGECGVFGTIGQPSNFVTGPKTVATFRVKKGEVDYQPDMRYNLKNPYQDLLKQHPDLDGADVNININKIHPSKVTFVHEE
jgi:hypothetical protein